MKYFNKVDLIDGALISAGLGISLQDIQSILSIIIICLDMLWIIAKLVIKFMMYIKDGEITKEELEDLDKTVHEIHIKDGDN